ncbi:MAG TPA: beta-ketoacyl synthase N-terminal-like domain-containing protein [Candidatus Acidoferrum sp.]|nr:beta-ketoacyl synthase N-terminal-like domain-containing protein [Candidatus Acidoferrum sp.]
MKRQAINCAIVGFAARYPGRRTVDEFWDALNEDRSLIEEMPESRRQLLHNAESAGGRDTPRHGMFLDDVSCFDRVLFSMSPPGAMFADPRQRILLEMCWAAIEDAGLKKTELADRRVGVFVGQDAWYWGSYADTEYPEYAQAQEFILPGNNPTFLASRISSLFGFRGPSLVLNTTCSSVYAAMHYACASLRSGECDYALVGGVTVFHRPPSDRFESTSNTMLSFSADAGGYVSSEGCGAFLLCRADLAAKSRHTQYAIVCASGCSSGATTKSFAQPSHPRLVALLNETLSSGGLTPEQIGYVEAHGIASPVGDAIEINALYDVLAQSHRAAPCLVSTIKPSIGHCHAASGGYSLIKAILALEHEKIPAIFGLRGRRLNIAIRSGTDGLRFLTEPVSWPCNAADGKNERYVLLPSFGFSNVNAAIVLRAVPATARRSPDGPKRNVAICLSAKSEPQLVTHVINLHRFVKAEIANRRSAGVSKCRLLDIAYTLQVGREAFQHRWATVVDSIEQLSEALAAFSVGKTSPENFRGVVNGKDSPTDVLGEKAGLAPGLARVAQSNDVARLAALWVAGAEVTWPDGHTGEQPRRAHLPTYPFARERYWLPESSSVNAESSNQAIRRSIEIPAPAGPNGRRPILRRVTSGPPEIQYRVLASGRELCLPDHKIRGRLVLSGAAHLELAVAALRDLARENGHAVCLRGHSWLRPLATDGASADVHVRIATDASVKPQQEIERHPVHYEIYTSTDAAEGPVVHACGVGTTGYVARPHALELRAIQAGMTRGVASAEECYSIFRSMGLDYGPAHRGIHEIYLGREEVLAKVTLSKELYGEAGCVVLHPGLLDSALQAYIGLYLRTGQGEPAAESHAPELLVPFGLDDFEVFEALPATMYSWVRRAASVLPGRVHKFDVDLCDESGALCARARGFSLRPLLPLDTLAEGANEGAAAQNRSAVSYPPLRRQESERISAGTNNPAARAEEYVRGVIARVFRLPVQSIATDAPFKEYGIDSLLASTITTELEKQFGPLPRTLFFEFENIGELAAFLDANRDTPVNVQTAGTRTASLLVNKTDVRLGTDLYRRLEAWGGTTFQNSVLFDAWPQLFVSSNNHGCLHVIARDGRIFATGTGYTRVAANDAVLVKELADYCSACGLVFSYLSTDGPLGIDMERRSVLLSLPVGCYQTIEDLSTFSLAGSRMRRLRYMVQRFRQSPHRTVEYLGGDPEAEDAIRAVLLEWSRPKGIVSNVDVVLRDLEQGTVTQRYRIFLTYLNHVLQNVIMILPIEGGYLMDQEYYLPTMPLGGTESAAVSIIDKLREEGHRRFSLGLTWRRFVPEAGLEFSDREGQSFLTECAAPVATMLDHGEQNYQHKSKYRPSEKTVYLYRPQSSSPKIIGQSLIEFVSSGLTVQEIEERIRASAERGAKALAQPVRVVQPAAALTKPDGIRLNLISDSWPYHDAPFVHERMAGLSATVAKLAGGTDHGRDFLGELPAVFALSGRLSERLFFRSFQGRRKIILQNILFETTRHNALNAGFTCIEMPDPRIFDPQSAALFRGGFDISRLEQGIAEKQGEIAMVYLELCNNGSGGYPVPLAQIRHVARLCRDHELPLVMDTTRIVRNAELIRRFDDACGKLALWEIVNEILSHCTHAIGSLCKDFAMNIGGVIATRDAELLHRVKIFGAVEGGLASGYYAKLMAVGALDRGYIERAVQEQLDFSAKVHQDLIALGLPVVAPGGGHCILIRASEIPAFADRGSPRTELLQHLSQSGIQAASHFVGNQQGTILNQCVRLAMPLGLPTDGVARQLTEALGPLAPPRTVAPPSERASRSPSLRETHGYAQPAVAIIGMSGRYPGATDLQRYWSNLAAGTDSIEEIPPTRWDWEEFYDADPQAAAAAQKSACKWGGFLEGVDRFDPLFFGIAPKDAEQMDPQERVFLEACWTALEDAGYSTQQLSELQRQRTAVFGGITNASLHGPAATSARPSSFARLVNRASYALDLHGPSIPIDSLCSSALVAIHEACEYIRCGRGDMALAGAVNLNLDPAGYVRRSNEGLLAHHRVGAFARGGTGYIPGEAVGVFVLKNHQQAVRDGDDVYAVICGSAVNHNGRMNAFGAPNPRQQAAVIRQALQSAGIDPRTVSYIESAASGVELSDAVEMAALKQVYSDRAGCQGEYRIGSVKPNVGHCEAAAGMSQATKAVLSLKYKTLLPTLISGALNPNVDFRSFPFSIQRETEHWQRVTVDGCEVPRRTGVTAVSAAGVNVHVILAENDAVPVHIPAKNEATVETAFLFVLSAVSREALERYVTRWMNYLESAGPKPALENIAHTLQVGRDAMSHRLAIMTGSIADLNGQLRSWRETGESTPRCRYGDSRGRVHDVRRAFEPSSQDLIAIAERWIGGEPISWATVGERNRRRRIAGLPTYPFAKRDCGGLYAKPHCEIGDAAQPVRVRATSGTANEMLCGAIHVLLQQILGKRDDDEIDDRTPFADMGFDSLKLARLVEGLNRQFDLSLTSTVPFEFPNVERMAAHLSALMAQPSQSSNTPGVAESAGVAADLNVDTILRDHLNRRTNFEDTLARLETLI